MCLLFALVAIPAVPVHTTDRRGMDACMQGVDGGCDRSCSGALELDAMGVCDAQSFPTVPRTRSRQVHLVTSGMQAQHEVETALALPRLTHLWLYNNEAGGRRCTSSKSVPGVWCGSPCNELALNATGGVTVRCIDRPNLGRGEAGFMQHVVEQYEELEGTIVFSQSTLSGDEGREQQLRSILLGEDGDGPSCSHPAPLHADIDWPTGPTCPDALRNSIYSLASPPKSGRCRASATCFANPNAADPCATLCNVSSSSWGHDRFQTMGAATPTGLGKWLRAHVPGSGPTVAPFCFLGYVRTTAEAIRRRPREGYAAILAELNKCANPEAAHYVERAMLHIFASY